MMARRSCVLLLAVLFAHASNADEIEVVRGGMKLKADLLLPDPSVCRRCPLVVIAHGSGTSARDNPWTSAWADGLVEQGIAVIHPDKRGSGQSGGNWREASIEDLAGDVAAFVDHAAIQPRVDPDRIGVLGFSQGGDVVPVAAATNDRIRFVASVSGSVVPLGEQMLDEVLIDAGKAGLTDAQVSALRHLHAAVMDHAREPVDYRQVLERQRAAAALSVPATFLEVPPAADIATWRWLRLVADFDPMPYWKTVKVPVAFIYGGQDGNVDTGKSTRLVREQLMSGKAPVSLVLFNENGHALFRREALHFTAAFAASAGAND